MPSNVFLAFIIYSLMLSMAFAQPNGVDKSSSIVFESGTQQVLLLEMYSSQGCSSCPPAEKWLNQLTTADQLWQRFIPVVFHVDYWDYLGWKDPYSHPAFSNRQAQLKQQGLIRSVYTPGFTLNGKEWRGWFSGKSFPLSSQQVGNLIIELQDGQLTARYSEFDSKQRLNVALLGFNLTTSVTAGENHRRVLEQEFVVLDYQTLAASDGKWSGRLPLDNFASNQLGFAAWVTQDKSLKPIQSVGGKLPQQLTASIHTDKPRTDVKLEKLGLGSATFLF
jgi:hypothetical protein